MRRDWAALGGSLSGELLRPTDPAYDAARRPWVPRFAAVRPTAIARCRTPEDVREAIGFARRSGLDIAARSGGHCFAGRSSTEGLLIDVSPMRDVSIDAGVATVGAGARLGDVYDAMLQHGATIPAGCGPTVGIAGLVLGGGLGILGRKHGLTADALAGATAVLADGRIVDCDGGREPDLFWALRGGGAAGPWVATSLRFHTVAAPQATVVHLVWPWPDAEAVLDAWQRWAPNGPDELAASFLIKAPPDPGRSPTVNVFGAFLGDRTTAAEVLAELVARVGTESAASTLESVAFRDAKRRLVEIGAAMGGESEGSAPRDPYSKSEYFSGPLPPEATRALLEHLEAERVPGQTRELDFTPWAGAYNRPAPGSTAFVHRDQQFLLKQGADLEATAGEAEREAARAWLGRSWELVHPWGSGGVYPNFPDPDLEEPDRAYYGSNLERLEAVRRSYAAGASRS